MIIVASKLPEFVWRKVLRGYHTFLFSWQTAVMLTLSGTTVHAAATKGIVVAWGGNNYGQANVPTGLINVIAIAAGGTHSLALKSDGSVAAWGDNTFGQSSVPSGLNNVVAIAGGSLHSLALKSDGTVVGWGSNNDFEATANGLSGVVAIAAGGNHSLALKRDGTLVAWGYNAQGQTKVPVGLSNVVAIAGGFDFSLALKSNATVVGWGDNSKGQINVPVGLSNVVSITCGVAFSLALKRDGTVVGWPGVGFSFGGMIGVEAIALGSFHALALKSGIVYSAGVNTFGQLNVPPGLINVVAISGGGGHSLALISSPKLVVERPGGANIGDGGTASFGSVLVSRPESLTFTIQNTGYANLTGLTITVDALCTVDREFCEFMITSSPTAPVVPGGSTTFTVRFSPVTPGTRSAVMHISHNATYENPFDISLTGTGISPDDRLRSLAISAGTLTPAFASTTTDYMVSVSNAHAFITVKPIVLQLGATVKVNGVTVSSGSVSSAINLSVGTNIVTILVTEPDRTTTTAYTLNVTRAAPPFAIGIRFAESGQATIEFPGVPGFSYDLQASTNLMDWGFISSQTIGSSGLFQFIDPNSASYEKLFFRARRQ